VQTIIAISDHPEIHPIIMDQAPNEAQARYASSAKARRLLGWQPAYTLEEGLTQTFKWYKEFLKGGSN
ncbi:MAG: sugar dehydratase, partial [Anaerolineae bacterium]